jgi:hypothetical protein
MTVQVATRTVSQQIRAVQVTPANAGVIFSLQGAVLPKYRFTTQVDAVFSAQGGTRIMIDRDEYPTQFAYQGDWIVVYDADFQVDGTGTPVWTVSPHTEVQVWGVSTGLPGTAADFTSKFTLGA